MKKRLVAFLVLVMMLCVPAAEAFSFKKAVKSATKKVKKVGKKIKKKVKKSSYIYDASGNKICFVVDDVKGA